VSHGGREAGVALVAVGLVTLAVATWRFAATTQRISSDEVIAYSPRSALWLGALIIALGLFVLAYVTRLLFATN